MLSSTHHMGSVVSSHAQLIVEIIQRGSGPTATLQLKSLMVTEVL